MLYHICPWLFHITDLLVPGQFHMHAFDCCNVSYVIGVMSSQLDVVCVLWCV